MAFGNWFAPQQKEVGDPSAIKQWSQLPLLSNPQQAAQLGTLGLGLYNAFQRQPSFEPIKQEYMRAYREKNLPGLLSNFAGNLNGGDFQRAVAQGDVDLATRLAGLQAEFQQNQFNKNREFAGNLLQMGLKPSQENLYAPVPYEAAKQYLIQQGNPNPTQADINAALPKFEPPQTLLGQAAQATQQAVPQFQQAAKAYQQGGPQGLRDFIATQLKSFQQAATGEVPIKNAPNLPGIPQNIEQLKAQQPDIQKAVEESTQRANDDQKSAADWILANKKAHVPLMSKKLDPGDYIFLKSMMESGKEAIAHLPYLINTKEDLDALRKVYEAGNERQLKNYLRKKYGIKEE